MKAEPPVDTSGSGSARGSRAVPRAPAGQAQRPETTPHSVTAVGASDLPARTPKTAREPRALPDELRDAQSQWAASPIHDRLRIIRELRHLIAENAETLATAAAAVHGRPVAEKLSSEVLPLADACRWLEREAARVLAPRREGSRGRPFWLQSFSFVVQRRPFGLVLVIGPGNYPLFLPAVHAIHSLVAGNSVLLKPAPGTTAVAKAFAQLCERAGLPPQLLTILPEDIATARNAIVAGVDKVIFTGSSENGRDVLGLLAQSNTPAVAELSGEDPVIVLADADLDLVVGALRFGSGLNGGHTCIAPRRLIVERAIVGELHDRLGSARASRAGLGALAETPFEIAEHAAHAIALANDAQKGLGATVFSRDIARAREVAAQLHTGFVLINDLIVPTADPRFPFGGVKASGFGTTRGAEGLLEMTFPHVVAVRGGRFRPHFDEPSPADAAFFATYLRAAHGRSRGRFAAIRDFVRALIHQAKTKRPTT